MTDETGEHHKFALEFVWVLPDKIDITLMSGNKTTITWIEAITIKMVFRVPEPSLFEVDREIIYFVKQELSWNINIYGHDRTPGLLSQKYANAKLISLRWQCTTSS